MITGIYHKPLPDTVLGFCRMSISKIEPIEKVRHAGTLRVSTYCYHYVCDFRQSLRSFQLRLIPYTFWKVVDS
jgi:hypothetical protein